MFVRGLPVQLRSPVRVVIGALLMIGVLALVPRIEKAVRMNRLALQAIGTELDAIASGACVDNCSAMGKATERCLYLQGMCYWHMPEDGVDRAIAAWRRSGSIAFERLATQGLNQFQAGNYDEAERWLAALLETEAPVHYSDTARFLLARITHERGETDVAVAQYAAVLKTAEAQGLLGVDVTEVYLHLGLGLAELEEWEEALDYLDKATRNEALMGIASRASARLLFESLGEQEDAVQLLERAYELQISDRTQTEILLANYLRQVGAYGRAVEVLNTTLLRNDRLVSAYGQLHAVYIESGDYGKSRDVALGCIDTRPEVSYCWMLAGISYLRLDQPKTAEEYFLEAVELQPTYKTWQYLAETYYALGDNQRARWAERMAESVRP